MIALHVDSLTKKFGDFVAVDSIHFEVKQGEIFGFLGANGAGKSTTIRMLCGILPPTSGQATLLNIDVARYPDKIKSNIGYMSQKFSLYPDLTVEENIKFFCGIHKISGPKISARTNEVLEFADLKGMQKRITSTLSGGWKQRLALGCALLHRPGVLFLDEPTSGVDPVARRAFWDIIFQLRKEGTTIFVTSHYMDEVEQCDRVALMHRGTIAAMDTPDRLKSSALPGSVIGMQCDINIPHNVINERIRSCERVLRIDRSGRGYHLITCIKENASIHKLEKEIQKRLSDLTDEAVQLSVVETTLEDVFVYLIGGLEK